MPRARRVSAVLIAAASITLILTGCHPTAASSGSPKAGASAGSSTAPKPIASASSAAQPVQVDASGYLLEGTPNVPDANGEWDGHYGFWTDATHAVSCDIWIFSGDSGGVSCGITPGHEGQRTYAVPSGIPTTCGFDPGDSYQLDGNVLAINYKIFGSSTATSNANVGFAGCLADEAPTAIDAGRKVLPPNSILAVTQADIETFTCSVTAAVASCSDSAPGSSFEFGLATATFHQG
jgi:hypothetical protein